MTCSTSFSLSKRGDEREHKKTPNNRQGNISRNILLICERMVSIMAYDPEKSRKRFDMGIETLAVDISAELKKVVGDAADEADVSMNEFVARVLAQAVERPELSIIPRKRPGRPRKVAVA
jgi:hypothetical protein